ncbi:MAG: FAD-dependent pyridine nucleotide-disulfide oxidoreductase [Actinomycetia bacterium]|nr:FAD-dependent pyridine nucleotide-disulfide oxidoreductase [Actinomycetes bacterium]
MSEGDAPRSIVIVGASLAGGTAATVLRDEGYDGSIHLIGAEDEPPYERPPLSKELLRGEASLEDGFLRPASWYEEHDVDARFGTRAAQIDPHRGEVICTGGERIAYDRLLVATGCRNRRLEVPGVGLPGVFDLRTHHDAVRIREAATSGARVVCVGMGFIGAEVAASLRSVGCDVTVVEIFETALYRILGPEIGRVLEAIHRDHGVTMHFNDTVERFEGDGKLERVVTEGGKRIDADVAVVGIGTEAAVEIMAGTGLDQGGGIPVAPTLETSVPGVFAIGDVARHDHPVFGPIRVEHYDNAIKMGEHAAKAMLGSAEVFDDPHWFWSDQYDSKIEMAGYAPTWDRMIVRGSLEDRSFCAFLLDDGGVLRSTVSLDRKRDVRRSFGLIRAQLPPDPALLADPDVDLRKLVEGEGK